MQMNLQLRPQSTVNCIRWAIFAHLQLICTKIYRRQIAVENYGLNRSWGHCAGRRNRLYNPLDVWGLSSVHLLSRTQNHKVICGSDGNEIHGWITRHDFNRSLQVEMEAVQDPVFFLLCATVKKLLYGEHQPHSNASVAFNWCLQTVFLTLKLHFQQHLQAFR